MKNQRSPRCWGKQSHTNHLKDKPSKRYESNVSKMVHSMAAKMHVLCLSLPTSPQMLATDITHRCLRVRTPRNQASWWFQPLWKILVKMGIVPNFRGKHKKSLKPPPTKELRRMPFLPGLNEHTPDTPYKSWPVWQILEVTDQVYGKCTQNVP